MRNIEAGEDLQKFKDYQPTQFDIKGLGAEGQEDWRVLPAIITRDSEVQSRSNFEVAQKLLDDAGVEYEVHRFSHWGPGWFEIIVVEPTEEGLTAAGKIACSLESYCILDEDDYSEKEQADANEFWDSWGRSEAREYLVKSFCLEPATEDYLDEHDAIIDGFLSYIDYSDCDGFNYGGLDDGHYGLTRSRLASAIREERRKRA